MDLKLLTKRKLADPSGLAQGLVDLCGNIFHGRKTVDAGQFALGVIVADQRRGFLVVFKKPCLQAFLVIICPALEIGRSADVADPSFAVGLVSS